MTVRKLLTGFVAVAGVLAFSADAQALGKRKKNKGCDSCATAAPACGGCGVAMVGPGGNVVVMAPEAMPATGTARTTTPDAVTPASGTTGGTVVPATGTTTPQTNVVIPAGAYLDPNGSYVVPAGATTYVEPSGTTPRTRRGLFRR